MTDTFIDLTSRPSKRYVTHRCHYCDHHKYPNGKVIDPTTDKHAKRTEKGGWICGECINEEIEK
jgi:hypothetical protein